ncbi:hypothetical protein SDC9_154145 [bioreactor metagenome]|uniref:Uncharacterized protein n=1 Tax=bioreactor metagenome TaxID=1076179 RepID=A0A645EXW3_9ZZZZ
MKKTCIFQESIQCSDCGECAKCDISENKKCNNCAKCLELEGFDVRAINIEEIMDEEDITFADEGESNSDIDIETLAELNKDLNEADIKIEYIDDIDGLSEILENENFGKYISEVFPGILVINKNIK